jgi:hypothetical protein
MLLQGVIMCAISAVMEGLLWCYKVSPFRAISAGSRWCDGRVMKWLCCTIVSSCCERVIMLFKGMIMCVSADCDLSE